MSCRSDPVAVVSPVAYIGGKRGFDRHPHYLPEKLFWHQDRCWFRCKARTVHLLHPVCAYSIRAGLAGLWGQAILARARHHDRLVYRDNPCLPRRRFRQ
ncbi:MAG: hypothetical protein V3T19_08430 [Acidiferrobacterales bacterium]